jgi:hypothetical protein
MSFSFQEETLLSLELALDLSIVFDDLSLTLKNLHHPPLSGLFMSSPPKPHRPDLWRVKDRSFQSPIYSSPSASGRNAPLQLPGELLSIPSRPPRAGAWEPLAVQYATDELLCSRCFFFFFFFFNLFFFNVI